MDGQDNLAVVVSAPTEIDASNAAELRAALVAVNGGRPAVVVDMSQTGFCDSAGVSVLVEAHHRAEVGGCEVRLAVTGASVLRIFALTGVNQLFRVFARQPGPEEVRVNCRSACNPSG